MSDKRPVPGMDGIKMKLNERDECGEMVEWNLWQGKKGRNPEKNLPRPRFVHHETDMEWPRRELGTPAVGGERLTFYFIVLYLKSKFEDHFRNLAPRHEGFNKW